MKLPFQKNPKSLVLTVVVVSILLIFMVKFGTPKYTPVVKVVVQSPKNTAKWLLSNGVKMNLPDATQVKSISFPDLGMAYHNYIEQAQIVCDRVERMGNVGDGGWEVCADSTHRPTPPCVVYSFGIDNDFSFDDMITKRYGCSVDSFDPSMNQESYKRSENVTFHNKGLASFDGKNGKWEMRRFSTIMNELGHKNVDVIKIDIEFWEWSVLPDLLSSVDVKIGTQLLVEFHVDHGRRQNYETGFPVLKKLYEKGFRIFLTRRNIHCKMNPEWDRNRVMYGCQEVHMIKMK